MTRMLLTRRHAAGLAAAAFTTPVAAQSSKTLDFTKPADNVTAYAKMVGSTVKAMTYLQYTGEIFTLVPGEVQKPLFRLKGLVKAAWTPRGDGAYSHVNYDHGLFCDAETGVVLDTFKNPYTGETNRPLHYKSGPFEATIGPKRADGTPFILNWDISGDDMRLTETSYGERDNWLQPKDWPRASTGEKAQMSSSSTYIARLSELSDPARSAVTATHFWTFIAPWPAWMLVGQKPGSVLWRWVGRKIIDRSELDPVIVAEIERRLPGYMTKDRPWTEKSNGWIQYMNERKADR
jgi:Protein of unknown function (DUF1838)